MKALVSGHLGFSAWAFWFVADRVELPFVLRFCAFGAFALSVLGAVSVWVHKKP